MSRGRPGHRRPGAEGRAGSTRRHVCLVARDTLARSRFLPIQNMPNYGEDMTRELGEAGFMLHLSSLDPQDKLCLAARLCQIGIDWWGVYNRPTYFGPPGPKSYLLWQANGGHHSGRKFPIFLAGCLLNDAGMKGIGRVGQEHDQLFYVVDDPQTGINNGIGCYTQTAANERWPEWGVRHHRLGGQVKDTIVWDENEASPLGCTGNGYRRCCTAVSWYGEALCVERFGQSVMDEWDEPNEDKLWWKYLERYDDIEMLPQYSGIVGTYRAKPSWILANWIQYHNDLEPMPFSAPLSGQ